MSQSQYHESKSVPYYKVREKIQFHSNKNLIFNQK